MYAASTTEQNPSPRHVGTPPATNTAGVAVRFYERNAGVSSAARHAGRC